MYTYIHTYILTYIPMIYFNNHNIRTQLHDNMNTRYLITYVYIYIYMYEYMIIHIYYILYVYIYMNVWLYYIYIYIYLDTPNTRHKIVKIQQLWGKEPF